MAPLSNWADGPWPLIKTPSATMNVSQHEAHYIANEMAFTHNAMIRGLNVLWLQCPHVSPGTSSAADFLFFAGAWAGWIAHHHDLEEAHMFPGFEAVPGVPAGAMQANVAQHHAFATGLQSFKDYVNSTKPEDYDAEKLRELLAAFADTFMDHLRDEIPALLALDVCGKEEGKKLLEVFRKAEKLAGKQDPFVVPPLVMGLADRTFQGGNVWPPAPAGTGYIVHYALSWRHKGAWRFLPSDAWCKPRPLQFLEGIKK